MEKRTKLEPTPDIMAVACPPARKRGGRWVTCGAAPRRRCKNSYGNEQMEPHAERRKVAEALHLG